MSVTNTKAKSVYNANGTTKEWNLGFTYDDTVSNVHIYIVDANDNETEVTSNYSIANGVLTYPTTESGLDPLAEGNKLVIVRDTPRTQDIELTSNGKLDGKVLEGGYDKLTLQVQELTEQVNRAVKIPVTEESADNFLDPITAITEAKKEALVEIAQATTPAEVAKDTAVAKAQVATEQATIATNAATSAKAAQAGAEAAEQNATAQVEKAEKAVTAYTEGLGTAKNAVFDLGTFDGKTGVTSSRVIDFDRRPIAVSLRFSDTNKKLWINGTNSTAGIEVVDDKHCNLFYSIASADFAGQNAVKSPFVVQAVIQYSVLGIPASEQEEGVVQLATKAEAEAGTNDTKAMTPLKTKYAIEANATVKTLRNDIDDLGDQVAVIEGKIPAEATTDNPLADKEFVTTITDELAADITALEADKQNKLTTAQLNAVNSGITSDKVTQYNNYATTKQNKLTAGANITISADNVISATGGGETPTNVVTTDTYQDITARKTFTEQIDFTGGARVSSLYSTTNQRIAGSWSGTMKFSNYDQKTEMQASDFSINTTNPNSGGKGPATLNGKQIATVDDVAAAGGGSGFDFEGTKAEFYAAVAAGTITDDSVSLITDDVSGDTVATKTDLAVALNERADKQLSNTNLITNCILSAPNGVMQVSSTDPYTLVALKGLKVALANGYNADGTPKSEIITLDNDISITTPSTTNYNWPIYVILAKPISDGAFRIIVPNISDFASVKVIPSNIQTDLYKVYYNSDTNTFYEHLTDGSLSEYKGVLLGFGKFVDSKFTDMVPYKPIQLSLEGLGDYVVEFQVNSDGSWYRKYKSGWLEQGGISTGQTVTFLKTFVNTNYTLTTACEYGSGDANNNIHVEYANNGKTTTGFSWAISIGSYVKAFNWEAKGMGAN